MIVRQGAGNLARLPRFPTALPEPVVVHQRHERRRLGGLGAAEGLVRKRYRGEHRSQAGGFCSCQPRRLGPSRTHAALQCAKSSRCRECPANIHDAGGAGQAARASQRASLATNRLRVNTTRPRIYPPATLCQDDYWLRLQQLPLRRSRTFLERGTGLEPATTCLEGRSSTS